MKSRKNVQSGAVWEAKIGYSRAVRIGNIIEVSGTTSINEKDEIVGKNDPYAQTLFIFNIIEKALHKVGAQMSDVIRTRMYVVNIEHWEEISKAHAEIFQNIRPAATMVEVSRLISDGMLVEIEVSAVLSEE